MCFIRSFEQVKTELKACCAQGTLPEDAALEFYGLPLRRGSHDPETRDRERRNFAEAFAHENESRNGIGANIDCDFLDDLPLNEVGDHPLCFCSWVPYVEVTPCMIVNASEEAVGLDDELQKSIASQLLEECDNYGRHRWSRAIRFMAFSHEVLHSSHQHSVYPYSASGSETTSEPDVVDEVDGHDADGPDVDPYQSS